MEDDSIREEVEARIRAEAEKFKSKDDSNELPLKFIADCLHANELGDGVLYATINHNSFIYEPSSGTWFYWNGVIFELDIEGRATGAMEKVVKQYSRYFSSLIHQKEEG